jgi:hypothetical protein
MRFWIVFLALLAPLAPARAEFVMLSPPAQDGGASRPAHAAARVNPKPGPRPKLARPAEPVLAGFGAQVPLRFAVRQIVPSSYEVAYGEAVDRDALVDWKGGKPWRVTLADAVSPLGLTVSVVRSTVAILARHAER